MEQRGEVISMIHGMKLNKAPFLMIECLITLAELILYRRSFPEFSLKRIFLYTMCANALSAAAGWFTAEPVWRFVVSIS